MATRHHRRRSALVGGFAVLAATGLGSPADLTRVTADSPASTGPLTLVTPTEGITPSVSETGQLVVFAGAPGSGAGSGRSSSIWLTDRLTATTTELTLPREGTRLGDSVHPVISADGCTVVITTQTAYDLFRDDDEGARWDVYRATLPACGGTLGDWVLVSTFHNADGQAQARNDVDPTETAAVSSSGSVIAYVRPFESLSGNDDPEQPVGAIDVVDLAIPVDDLARITPAPGLPTEIAGNSVAYVGQTSPALSADGSTLAFVSDASSQDAVADWIEPVGAATTVPTQVFAWDRNDADPFTAVARISSAADAPGDASSFDPAISADGRIIAFASSAANLVNAEAFAKCATGCPSQIYVIDRDTDGNGVDDEPGLTSVRLVSQADGVAGSPITIGNGASFAPTLSADGSALAFSTKATNLLQVQTPGGGGAADGDLLIADLANGVQLRRAFDSLTPAPAAHGAAHFSANGRVLVADSAVAGEVLGDPALVGRHVIAATSRPTLSIASLDLGTVLVAVPGEEWFANVVNLGPGAFTPESVTIDNPDFAISGGSCVTDKAPVKPGTSCSVKLILTPTVAGPVAGTLTVAEVGFDAMVLTAPVKGAGGEPALDASPKAAEYGTEVVGNLSQFTEVFDVTSVSPLPTFVGSATMTGSNPDDFFITSSTCGVELAFGASCPIEVSFRPTGSGRRTATLNIATLSGQYTSVLLSGEGVYNASLITSATVAPGQDLGIGGSGFPGNTGILLSWSDGSGRTMLINTNAEGEFLTNFGITRSQRPGPATLVAQATDGTTATFVVEIERTQRRSPRPRG